MEITRRLLKKAPALRSPLWKPWLPTGAMKPTILEGDMIVVNKLADDLKIPFSLTRLAQWSDPEKGDVVVLFSPEDGMRLAKESPGGTDHWMMALPGRGAMRDFPEMTVPEGRCFVMGDSRDNSKDSRFIGFIERKQIVGRAEGLLVSANLKRFCLPRFRRFFSKLDR